MYLYKFDTVRYQGLGALMSSMLESFCLLKTSFAPARVRRVKCCSCSSPETWSDSGRAGAREDPTTCAGGRRSVRLRSPRPRNSGGFCPCQPISLVTTHGKSAADGRCRSCKEIFLAVVPLSDLISSKISAYPLSRDGWFLESDTASMKFS